MNFLINKLMRKKIYAFIEWLLKREARSIVNHATGLDKLIRAQGLIHEQWWLDYQDDLNALSIR